MARLPKTHSETGELLTRLVEQFRLARITQNLTIMADNDLAQPFIKVKESIWQTAFSKRSNKALIASILIGRTAMITNNVITRQVRSTTIVLIEIHIPIEAVTVVIVARSGQLVRRVVLYPLIVGLFEYHWDGLNECNKLVLPGDYFIYANGVYAGRDYALKTMTAANINSVSLGKDYHQILLHVAGMRVLSLNQIIKITAQHYLIINN
jgi:flagellar basal-body rod modification protein FlgD